MVKYLVRPHDKHIFELDLYNNCYRSYSNRSVTRSDGTRPNAQEHFTFENLTQNYGFFPISEDELEIYEFLNQDYCDFISRTTRSDGHGGTKGGTYDDYLKQKK